MNKMDEEEAWTEETEHIPECTCGSLDLEIVHSNTRCLERKREHLNDCDRIVVIDVQDEYGFEQGWDALCQSCGKVLE